MMYFKITVQAKPKTHLTNSFKVEYKPALNMIHRSTHLNKKLTYIYIINIHYPRRSAILNSLWMVEHTDGLR